MSALNPTSITPEDADLRIEAGIGREHQYLAFDKELEGEDAEIVTSSLPRESITGLHPRRASIPYSLLILELPHEEGRSTEETVLAAAASIAEALSVLRGTVAYIDADVRQFGEQSPLEIERSFFTPREQPDQMAA